MTAPRRLRLPELPRRLPATLADVRSALRSLDPADAARVDLAFVTSDPDRDTPEELTEYPAAFLPTFDAVRADAMGLAPALDAFLATAEVTVAADGTVEVAHSAVLYAIDERGIVVVEWPFGTSATALADDLRRLLGESA